LGENSERNLFMLQKLIKIIIALLSAVSVSFLFSQNPLLALLFCLSLLFCFLIFLNLEFGLALLIFSLVLGQAIRIQIPGAESFFLPSDVIIPAMILFWLAEKLIEKKFVFPKNSLDLPLALFLSIALVSLIWGSRNLALGEILVSAFYWLRFLAYSLLFYLVLDLARDANKIKKYLVWLFSAACLLAILGFLQYIFLPDFSFMAAASGWDPHVKRLLSTWFDPNLIGGFFVFILSFAISFLLYGKERKTKIILLALIVVLGSALILTYSRSAFLALLVSLFVLGILKSKKLLFVGLIALIILIGVSGRLQARLAGATRIDVMAEHRLASWKNTWEISRSHLFLGVGFNTFKYAQLASGAIGPQASHSDFGSDSSFLTILATTGVFGLIIYLWLALAIFKIAFQAFRQSDNRLANALGLGLIAGMAGLVIHSQFTNSLLYGHLMAAIWIFAGLVESVKFKAKSVK